MPKIYSYYANCPGLDMEDELRLSMLWRSRWQAIGFEPIILNEWIAVRHPYFAEFDAAISKLPTINPAAYERSCFLRHLGLAQVGGGWMADLDLYPNPRYLGGLEPIENVLKSFESQEKIQILQTPCCPCLTYASQAGAMAICQAIVESGLRLGNRPQSGKDHVSDMYILEGLLDAKTGWLQARDIVRQYGDPTWKEAPFVHCSNGSMTPRKLTPRWQHIPAILDE